MQNGKVFPSQEAVGSCIQHLARIWSSQCFLKIGYLLVALEMGVLCYGSKTMVNGTSIRFFKKINGVAALRAKSAADFAHKGKLRRAMVMNIGNGLVKMSSIILFKV